MKKFFESITSIPLAESFNLLLQDLKRNMPRGFGDLFNILASPGIISVIMYRFNQFITGMNIAIIRVPLLIIGLIIYKIYSDFYGIKISRKARIGGGLKVAHFGGIFVHNEVVAGINLTISPGVIIGISGSGEKRGCPVIGDNVYVGPHAVLHGKISIGNNVKIGSGAVVFFDVPDNSTIFSPRPTVKQIITGQ